MFLDHFHLILLKQLRRWDFLFSTILPFFFLHTYIHFSVVANILTCKPQSSAGIIVKLTSLGSTSTPRWGFIIPHIHYSNINNNNATERLVGRLEIYIFFNSNRMSWMPWRFRHLTSKNQSLSKVLGEDKHKERKELEGWDEREEFKQNLKIYVVTEIST